MSRIRTVLGLLVVSLAMGRPLAAQTYGLRDDSTHAFFVSVYGGGFNALTNANSAGTANFKKAGFNVGTNVGVQLHPTMALRTGLTYARNELRLGAFNTGQFLDRYFYDAGVQFQPAMTSGLRPYMFVGAGGVTVHQNGTRITRTRPAANGGIGFEYMIPRSPAGLFAEGKGWVYRLEDLGGPLTGASKTQFEMIWSGGLSVRAPF